MLEDFRNASPLEFAAFFELGQFITGDIEAVATKLLTQGYDGENLANLAFGFNTTGLEEIEGFQQALIEAGVTRTPSKKESLWISIRFFLKEIIDNPDNAIEHLRKLINLYGDFSGVELFDRPDCDAYFEEKKKTQPYSATKFAAQEWGIESLYSIYYSSDDWNYSWKKRALSFEAWISERKQKQRSNAISEAEVVLEKHYRLCDNLPKDLTSLLDFIELKK